MVDWSKLAEPKGINLYFNWDAPSFTVETPLDTYTTVVLDWMSRGYMLVPSVLKRSWAIEGTEILLERRRVSVLWRNKYIVEKKKIRNPCFVCTEKGKNILRNYDVSFHPQSYEKMEEYVSSSEELSIHKPGWAERYGLIDRRPAGIEDASDRGNQVPMLAGKKFQPNKRNQSPALLPAPGTRSRTGG